MNNENLLLSAKICDIILKELTETDKNETPQSE